MRQIRDRQAWHFVPLTWLSIYHFCQVLKQARREQVRKYAFAYLWAWEKCLFRLLCTRIQVLFKHLVASLAPGTINKLEKRCIMTLDNRFRWLTPRCRCYVTFGAWCMMHFSRWIRLKAADSGADLCVTPRPYIKALNREIPHTFLRTPACPAPGVLVERSNWRGPLFAHFFQYHPWDGLVTSKAQIRLVQFHSLVTTTMHKWSNRQ